MTFKALYDTNFSDYLNIDLHKVDSYNLRSSEAPTIRVPTIENNTFHDLAVSVFNHLPAEVRNITLRKTFFIDSIWSVFILSYSYVLHVLRFLLLLIFL